ERPSVRPRQRGDSRLSRRAAEPRAHAGFLSARRATPSLYKARDDVYREGEDHDVEEEGQHAVGKADAAEAVVLDLHVGDLEGHADGEGEIEEVPVVRIRAAGEGEA